MQISSSWLTRIADKVRSMFARTSEAVSVAVDPPSVATAELIEAPIAPRMELPRMLSARIACQAKLNVPVGKKPRVAHVLPAKAATRRPKTVVEVKTTAKVRSVYLPARHLAAKSRPKPRSNVITLPITAKKPNAQVKAPIAKLRLAA